MSNKYIFLLFLNLCLAFNAAAMDDHLWLHDKFESFDTASKLEDLTTRLKSLKSNNFWDWQDEFRHFRLRDMRKADWFLLETLFGELERFDKLIWPGTYKKLESLFVQFLKESSRFTKYDFKCFAFTLRNYMQIDGSFDFHAVEAANDIVHFVENNYQGAEKPHLILYVLRFCQNYNIALSRTAEKVVLDSLEKNGYDSLTLMQFAYLSSALVHFRLPLDLKILDDFLHKLVPSENEEFAVSTISSLFRAVAMSLLCGNLDKNNSFYYMNQFLSILNSAFLNVKNISGESYNRLQFALATYETYFGKAAIALPKPIHKTYTYNRSGNCWLPLLSELHKHYRALEEECYIELIDSPVDAYLEIYGQKFIIQFDGPFHFLFKDNDRNHISKSDGPTKAQTMLLQKNGYEVIRVDYLETQDDLSKTLNYIIQEIEAFYTSNKLKREYESAYDFDEELFHPKKKIRTAKK